MWYLCMQSKHSYTQKNKYLKRNYKKPKEQKPWHWAGEMIALWLGVLAALAEEPVPGDITPTFSM